MLWLQRMMNASFYLHPGCHPFVTRRSGYLCYLPFGKKFSTTNKECQVRNSTLHAYWWFFSSSTWCHFNHLVPNKDGQIALLS